MRKNFKKPILATLLATSLIFSLTACSNEQGSNAPATSSDSEQNVSEETKSESAVITDESVLQDGKLGSSAWKDGILKINGKIFALTKTTLEQFTQDSGYTADEAVMNYICHYGIEFINLENERHQKTKIEVNNYSHNKPLYCKHALISGYDIYFGDGDGLDATDAVFPGNIKGGMTKDEIISIVGTPKKDNYDTSLSYEYKENDTTIYSVDFYFVSDTHRLDRVTYRNSQESENVADDSSTIISSVDTTSNSSLTDKSEPSDILKDAEIKIGNNVYTMLISMTDLSELGYSIDEKNVNYVLNAKNSIMYPALRDKDYNSFASVTFYNPSDKPRALSNCLISELDFSSDNKCKNVTIAQGIKIGSTYNEVCSAFGKKKKNSTSSDDYFFTEYKYSAKQGEVKVVFTFKKADNKLDEFTMSVEELTQD